VSLRREIVHDLVTRGVSERRACRFVGLHRSSYRYRCRPPQAEDQQLRQTIVTLAHRHRRYGYRRITALLRRQGKPVNPKRVHRIWQQEGLQLPRKRPRKRRAGAAVTLPTQATHGGHVWTVDFVFDQTERGQLLKLLVVLDEYTRECHQIRVATRADSQAVIATLAAVSDKHGAPAYLRSDNGGEFIARVVGDWLAAHGSQTAFIAPGHPWENGYAESFIGKLRDECLNEEVFWNVRHAQVVVEWWRRHYNEDRPHSALGYRTPRQAAEEARTLMDSPPERTGGQ
jgi:putative transposase